MSELFPGASARERRTATCKHGLNWSDTSHYFGLFSAHSISLKSNQSRMLVLTIQIVTSDMVITAVGKGICHTGIDLIGQRTSRTTSKSEQNRFLFIQVGWK